MIKRGNKKVNLKINSHYNFFPKSRKASHVGIVLSFIIFVTFLVFLYSILEPSLNVERDKQALLDHLKIDLLKMFEEDLVIVTVEVKKEGNCLSINRGEFGVEENWGLIVKDEFGIIDEIISDGKKILWLYYSKEFEDSSMNGDSCVDTKIKTVDENKYIFKTKVDELVLNYTNDLEILRTELEIPEDSGFGFRLLDKERIVSA